jgi:hypothetical protein
MNCCELCGSSELQRKTINYEILRINCRNKITEYKLLQALNEELKDNLNAKFNHGQSNEILPIINPDENYEQEIIKKKSILI